jgi:hypothetical protein
MKCRNGGNGLHEVHAQRPVHRRNLGNQMSEDSGKPFDPFELTAAVLLGIGAIGASLASFQEGLWGGQSVEGYGEAAAMTTKASSTYNDELTTYMQDAQIDVRSKELIWEGNDNKDDAAGERQLGMASWMLLSQLSDAAYEHLKLPKDLREKYMAGNADDAVLTPEQLNTALETDLEEDYVTAVFSTSQTEFDAADKRFAEGRDANNKGDQFSMAGVIFTVALFFAGLSLVFKTRMRWAFLGIGATVLAGAIGFMSTLAWA